MLKFRALIGLTLLLGLLTTEAKAQTDSVTFTLTNSTSRTLEEFYASPPSTSDWEDDILGVESHLVTWLFCGRPFQPLDQRQILITPGLDTAIQKPDGTPVPEPG